MTTTVISQQKSDKASNCGTAEVVNSIRKRSRVDKGLVEVFSGCRDWLRFFVLVAFDDALNLRLFCRSKVEDSEKLAHVVEVDPVELRVVNEVAPAV